MANVSCSLVASDSPSVLFHSGPPTHQQGRLSCTTFVESASGITKSSLRLSRNSPKAEKKLNASTSKSHQIVCTSHPREFRSRNSDIFDVSDPWSNDSRPVQWESFHAWHIMRNDVLYLDYRARRDVLAIKSAHDKVVEILNPLVKENRSIENMRESLQTLQDELNEAHEQVHVSEARVQHTLQRLSEMESLINQRTGNGSGTAKPVQPSIPNSTAIASVEADEQNKTVVSAIPVSNPSPTSSKVDRSRLNVSGPTKPYSESLKNFWYPVAFSKYINESTLIPIDSFEEPWVIFRGADGRPGCIRDECAHRACPLSLGTVVEGRVQCPYHGWEYSTGGECEKMPSTKASHVQVKTLPCVEHEGMIWIWPGKEIPDSSLPSLLPPSNYTIHAEIVLELPVEHGLLVENLLDLAHAPFTHTTTFAKGWEVPALVRFKNAATSVLQGKWEPYPIDMEFRPPCMVLSTIGLAKPGKLEGTSASECKKHLFQMHSCMPSTLGKTRLLYRMGLDFADWAKFVPFIDRLWVHLANQVLSEDLRLVLGQQDRMKRGANVWNHPVPYDKLGVGYRRWRRMVEGEESWIERQ